MRRLLTTIVCVLCVLTASAVSYGASYKGSRYSGGIYTTSSSRSTTIGSGGVLAATPLASMGSTSAYGSKASRMSPVGTSGAAMVGGVISGVHSPNIIRLGADKDHPPSPGDEGYCSGCGPHYVWDPDANAGDGGWVCSECGHGLEEGCHCNEGPDGYCRCPIGDGWQVWLFMAVMAFAYAVFKKRKASL